MIKKILFGNFKGGTGKTTNSCMIAYSLSRMDYKTLLVDLDPQANATALLLLTAQTQQDKVIQFPATLMTAIANNKLASIITPINDHLDILPSFADFTSYPLFLEQKFPTSQLDRIAYFSKLLKPLETDYDYILIDVPPTLSIYTDSAMYASDGIVIVLQTQERSFVGAQAFVQYTQELYDTYKIDFDVVGILPVLLKNQSAIDASVLRNAKKEFSESNIFENVMVHRERLKRYDMTGIVDPSVNETHDVHDLDVHDLYNGITKELLQRVQKLEAENG